MKKFLLLLVFASAFFYSQNRIYFDSAWAVTSKDKSVYYRETEKKGDLTLIKDYYKNGTLQMDGLASDPTPGTEIYEGKVSWYYPNGRLQSFVTYKNGSYVGESKSYDENGSLTGDLVYDAESDFSGTEYTRKNPEAGVNYNMVSYYKKSALTNNVIYDTDIKGIRTETEYSDSYNPKETRYYDEKGKLIGSLKYKEDFTVADKSTQVDYYYNPMRVASVTKYGKAGEIAEKKEYFKTGKLKSDFKKSGNSAKSTFYSTTGTKIAELDYKKSKDDETTLEPYNGKELTYYTDEGLEDQIYQEKNYKDGKVVTEISYRENNTINSVTEYEKSADEYGYSMISKVTYYNENSTVRSVVDYLEGLPYNGISYEDGEAQYINGVLVSEKKYDDKNVLRLERKPVGNDSFEVKIYDENKKLRYQYTYPNQEYSYNFNGTVKSYVTGKEQVATFENGIITKGKIRYKDTSNSTEVELERSGDWIIKRSFDEKNNLKKEVKEKIEDIDNYFGEALFYEQLLTYFTSSLL